MQHRSFPKFVTIPAVFLVLWLGFKYLFPLFLPFVLGAALALGAEPIVKFLCRQSHAPRWLAAAVGVSIGFSMVALVLLILAALAVKELGALAGILPDMTGMIQNAVISLQDWLLSLAAKAPDGVEPVLTNVVNQLFSGSSALIGSAAEKLLSTATGLLGRLPGGALGLGTGILSAFMISAKLPAIRDKLWQAIPDSWRERYLPAIREIRKTLTAWLKAQAKLAGMTFLIVMAGLFLLRIPYAPLWAALIALVDAVPMLGTGTVMVPWAVVCFLQGEQIRGFGLLGIYAAAALTRSVLEPRLVGRHLGLDPLVTLIALYMGFRLWGMLGMIFAPMVAVVAIRLTGLRQKPEEK